MAVPVQLDSLRSPGPHSPTFKSPPLSPGTSYFGSPPGTRRESEKAPLLPPLLRPIASHPLGQAALDQLSALLERMPRSPVALPRGRLVYILAFIALLSLASLTTSHSSSKRRKLRNERMRPLEAGRGIGTVAQLCPRSSSWEAHTPTIILKASQKLRSPLLQRTNHLNASLLCYAHPELSFGSSRPSTLSDRSLVREGDALCALHRIPTSPVVPPLPMKPKRWRDGYVMMGVATTAERGLHHYPIWRTWLPSRGEGQGAVDPNKKDHTRDNTLLMVLLPPPKDDRESQKSDEFERLAKDGGAYVKATVLPGERRFEERYFLMAREMFALALAREKKGHIKSKWFVFIDDDTFFPDWNNLVQRLDTYDSSEPHLVGALSEAPQSIEEFGYFAYGGAGIAVSRALMELINEPGMIDYCLGKWGALFGGDQMVSNCAAYAADARIDWLLRVDPGLHQNDQIEDASGFFQSGFLITTIHHWDSWTRVFPQWVMKRLKKAGQFKDERRDSIALLGKVAKAIGGENLARRYVFEQGKAVVHLGYSIVIYAEPLTEKDLTRSEHTWYEWPTFHPMRRELDEGTEKKSYFLRAVENVDTAGVWRLEHEAKDGEKVDVIFDARGRFRESTKGWIW